MAAKIAACGLNCNECEAYIATKNNNTGEFAKIAEKWNQAYSGDICPENCICDGCMEGGRLSTAHANECSLRICAINKGVPTCAHCPDYMCDTMKQFISFAPELGKKLAIIHDNI